MQLKDLMVINAENYDKEWW